MLVSVPSTAFWNFLTLKWIPGWTNKKILFKQSRVLNIYTEVFRKVKGLRRNENMIAEQEKTERTSSTEHRDMRCSRGKETSSHSCKYTRSFTGSVFSHTLRSELGLSWFYNQNKAFSIPLLIFLGGLGMGQRSRVMRL